jgi:hypothetical protein
MEVRMRGFLVLIVAVMMSGFAGPVLALDGGTDCAEGADEDLVTSNTEADQPAAPNEKPLS